MYSFELLTELVVQLTVQLRIAGDRILHHLVVHRDTLLRLAHHHLIDLLRLAHARSPDGSHLIHRLQVGPRLQQLGEVLMLRRLRGLLRLHIGVVVQIRDGRGRDVHVAHRR